MKFLTLIFASSLFLNFHSESPIPSSPDSTFLSIENDSTTVFLFTFGLVDIAATQDDCAVKLQQKYGFAYKSKGDCFMNDLDKMRKINANNRKSRAVLESRHGEDWETQYEEKLKLCRTEE